ncbi:hypothetical protein UACE39S_01731 [Ureibacillus acetophenoni]
MIYKEIVSELVLPNEQQFLDLLKRNPADPLIYLLKVQDTVGVDIQDYYRILQRKYEEEKNIKLHKIVSEYLSAMKDRNEE